MTLGPGSRFGPYRVVAPLGAGGRGFLPGSEGSANYDVAPDGRFAIVRPKTAELQAGKVEVILNWFEELRRVW